MGKNARRGHTGSKVEEAGTYSCEEAKAIGTFVRGDIFPACPATNKPTVWEKTGEPDHPGGTR